MAQVAFLTPSLASLHTVLSESRMNEHILNSCLNESTLYKYIARNVPKANSKQTERPADSTPITVTLLLWF